MPSADTAANAHCQARLFDAQGQDVVVGCGELQGLDLADHQLLWIDLRPEVAELDDVWAALELPAAARQAVNCGSTTPELHKRGDVFWVRVVAVSSGDGLVLRGTVLTLVAARNIVLSVHDGTIPFLETVVEREATGSDIGALCAESFVAALLDWHLASYFEAVADFEIAVERLEGGILAVQQRESLPELRRLRKAASRLRRMLAPHRAVFSALSRPDFRPGETAAANAHFAALDLRFERALDMVENTRDLVIGSFELFSSQVALQTNDSMRRLAFITMVIGVLAVIAGVLGMNFDAPLFKTQATGFWSAVAAMLLLAGAAVAVARWRRWF